MPNNFLITGEPGSGKTSIVKRSISILRKKELVPGGVYCPEIRDEGIRKGFKIVNVMNDNSRILAHVNQEDGPKVSKYRVNVSNIDEISKKSIELALEKADFIVIDEIAPMEVYSEEFKKIVKKALDSLKPVIAVIHMRSKSGFIGEVKNRSDIQTFQVNPENRDRLPNIIARYILNSLNYIRSN